MKRRDDEEYALEAESPTSQWVDKFAGIGLSIFIDLLVLMVLVALAWTLWIVGVDLYHAVSGQVEFEVKNLFVEILTIFIFIEIFHSLLGYLRNQRIHIRKLTDVSIAIVFRELWIGLFGMQFEWPMVLAFAGVIIALGALRVALARVEQTAEHPASEPE